jgi:predicted enzyme related to lactoylglutathione lyase
LISGVHALIYTKHVEAVKSFLRDVLEWPFEDAGNDRLIFAAPPLEVGIHETDSEPGHELYLICDDVEAAVSRLSDRGIATTPIVDRGWGLVTSVTMPGGETIGMYEPHHASPLRTQ